MLIVWTIVGLYTLFSGMCILYNVILRRDGYTGIPWVECFDPRKWLSVLIGFVFKVGHTRTHNRAVRLRLYDDQCRPECYKSEDGKCTHCGCDAIAKAMSPQESCSRGNWGPIILSKKKYHKHREEFPVQIITKYGKFI